MPNEKNKKTARNLFAHFLHHRPVLSYVVLTVFLMGSVFFLEQSARFYQASILNIPSFNGTFMPVTRVPNWVKTGGKNDRHYSDYSSGEMIYIPAYEPEELATKCDDWGSGYTNACGTYTTVYMGNYKLDHQEYAGSHLATDIRIPTGTPIYSVANGVVDKAKYQSSGFGNHIVVKHPNVPLIDGGKDTLYSSYSHLSSLSVSQNEVVEKGDLIGYSGNTGTSTTPHIHFQIDKSSAPWHPWWPFSSTQASSAGLSFFQGVNAALGQKEAMKNTVNPVLWVQEYLNYDGGQMTTNSNSDTTTSVSTTSSLASFTVVGGRDKVNQNEDIVLVVTAMDSKKKRMTSYDGKNIQVTPSIKNSTVNDFTFRDGRATIIVSFANYGRMSVAISDGNVSETTRIQVLKAEDTSTSTSTQTDTEKEIYNISSVGLSSDADIVLGGKSTEIEIRLYDAEGKLITNPKFTSPLELRVSGSGRVKPEALQARYFKNGVAKVDFYSEKTAGESQVFLTEFPNKKVTFQVVEAVSPVSAFSIESDGFRIGKAVPVYISTLDNNKKRTLRSFRGSAKITVESGKAKLSKTTITSKDFVNGNAEISLTSLSKDPIILSIKSGVIVGKSKSIRETKTAESVFNDVSSTHKNADAISYLKKKSILNGNPDGSFRPNGSINRAEFAKVMLLALDIDSSPAKGGKFSDVPKNSWYAEYVETAAILGIINGYPDGSFRPNGSINRAEVFAMIARASESTLPSYSSFSDVDSSAWYASSAEYAKQNELLDFGGSFYPSLKMTRAEVAESVARFMKN